MKNKKIKSVGFSFEENGIFDDREGLDVDFVDFFYGESESQEFGFKEGVKEFLEEVKNGLTTGLTTSEEELNEILSRLKKMLSELNESVKGKEVVWRLWSVEYDINFGVEILK